MKGVKILHLFQWNIKDIINIITINYALAWLYRVNVFVYDKKAIKSI